MKRPVYWLIGALGAALLSFVGAVGVACGTIDCTETATCPGQALDATDENGDVIAAPDVVEEGGDAGVGEEIVEVGGDGPAEVSGDSGRDRDATGAGGDPCSLTEDCTNGIDDNCDGLVDCADPQCIPNYSCTPAFPPGWSGPIAVFEQDGDGAAPTVPPCPAAYPGLADDGHATPTAASTSCPCMCQGPCSLVVSTYTNGNCGGSHLCAATTVATSCVAATGGCMDRSTDGAVQTAKITTGVAFAGCTASAQKNIPPYRWVTTGRACATGRTKYFQGGCDAGEVCADTPPSTFARGLCVYQSGTPSCPTTGYAVAHTYYADAGDSRDCDASACQCTGPASGGTCTATNVTISSASNCSGGATLGGSCVTMPFPSTSSPYIGAALSYSGGSCTPTGTGSPIGAVTENTPTTVCCRN